ncbi:MAG TPA: diiron oxygenase [Kribbella sp.]
MAPTALATNARRSAPQSSYQSRFGHWEARASVRAKPRRILDEHLDGKLFFPPELVSVLAHPAVAAVTDSELVGRILMHRLHAYLTFTTDLEQLVVNPVTQLISRQRLDFQLPQPMLRDAYKICTDESWHALFSEDLGDQIIAATGEEPIAFAQPWFLSELDRLKSEEDSSIRGLTEVFFTVVSETLISAILCGIPHDKRIISAVRETVADHAEDEGRHHAFYASFFEYAWHQLGPTQRAAIGPLLPQFVTAFLAPDFGALSTLLGLTTLDGDTIRGVIEETNQPTQVKATIRKAASSTLRIFERNGVFDDPRTRDAFAEKGLLDA